MNQRAQRLPRTRADTRSGSDRRTVLCPEGHLSRRLGGAYHRARRTEQYQPKGKGTAMKIAGFSALTLGLLAVAPLHAQQITPLDTVSFRIGGYITSWDT